MSYRSAFDLDDGVVWLNSAHQGALPRAAVTAATEAARWKARPWELTTQRFVGVPAALRASLGRLVGVPADEVMLANGSSFGLHALALGLALDPGDEVLVMQGDFPSNILPWLLRERDGVAVRTLTPSGPVLSPEGVGESIGPRTKVVCVSWVHSFSGHALDIQAIGALCRKAGVTFVVNATQALGVRTIDLATAPVDAIVASGWKWLCGPYATGFFWVRPELRARLSCRQAYWLSMQTADDLARTGDPALPSTWGPRQFEIFGTANFLNFHPFHASVRTLTDMGMASIRHETDGLVERFIAGLDQEFFQLVSPREGPARSTLVVFGPRDRTRTEALHRRLLDAGVVTAHRRGNIRISPHVYNTAGEIDRVLEVLDREAR